MFASIRPNSSPRAAAFSVLAVFVALPGATDMAFAQHQQADMALAQQAVVIGWGAMVIDSRLHEQSFVEVAAGGHHTVARRSNGSVVAWGLNAYQSYVSATTLSGQCTVPTLPPGLSYVDVAAGRWHTVALRSDGSAVAWGWNYYGQCNVPALPPGLSYVEVAAGEKNTVARRSDGSVVGWGDPSFHVTVPAGLSFVEVDAGTGHTLARRSDGNLF